MKYMATKIFFLIALFYLASIIAYAQNVTSIDADQKSANEENYKRVITYKEPIVNFTANDYGNVRGSVYGFRCSLVDYYKTGEPALKVDVISVDVKCSQWLPDGQAVHYYRDGEYKRKESYYGGKLHGTVIFYNEDGTEAKRVKYVNGKLIEEGKFAVPSDSPLIGTWKYVEYYESRIPPGLTTLKIPPSVKRKITLTFSQNGILEITNEDVLSRTGKTNWKYISKGNSSGVLELYQGDEMIERANVRWLTSSQIEYTVTFSQNTNSIDTQLTFTKQ